MKHRNREDNTVDVESKEIGEIKVGFIGLGHMADAMIGGILKKKLIMPENIMGYCRTEATRKAVKEKYGILIGKDNKDVVNKADILFLAVKPNMLRDVIDEIKDEIYKETLIVSIAPGKTVSFLESSFGAEKAKIFRCMPNTPALVRAGCTGVCAGENVEEDELGLIIEFLNCFGKTIVVPEHLMDAVVGVSGSSPAYVFMFIEAMADAAVLNGMPRDMAYQFAAQSVMGSAKLMLETGKHPGELKDMVCSPGGTTIRAVKVLEEENFRGAIIDAVDACIEKSKTM